MYNTNSIIFGCSLDSIDLEFLSQNIGMFHFGELDLNKDGHCKRENGAVSCK